MIKLNLSNSRGGLTTKQRIIARLLRNSYIDEDGCHIWTGAKSKTSGYGLFNIRINRKHHRLSVHRVAYAVYKGPIPPGFEVDHECSKKLCIREECLTRRTHSENMKKHYERQRAKKQRALTFKPVPSVGLGD